MKIENGDDCLRYEVLEAHMYNSFKRLPPNLKDFVRSEARREKLSIEDVMIKNLYGV